jgi:predicted transposase/invertase (TIGR01784 family)
MIALSKLVSALIVREVEIETITANEPAVNNVRDRQLRFDINCRAENGELINVEMCFYPKPFEPIRLEFHAGKLFIGQDIRGEDKDYNDLKRTYQIAIMANRKFFNNDSFYHSFEYYDPENKVSLGGKTKIITLELCKLGKVVKKSVDEMDVREQWAVFMEYLTDTSKRGIINKILEREEGIAMASRVVMTISRDEEERARIMRDEKILLDYQCEMAYAKKERKRLEEKAIAKGMAKGMQQGIQQGMEQGMQQGMAQGIQQGMQQIALNLKNMGLPVEQIAQGTGLSVEVIQRL